MGGDRGEEPPSEVQVILSVLLELTRILATNDSTGVTSHICGSDRMRNITS